MKRFNITVNGKAYDVAVEEIDGGSAPAVSAAPAPAAAAPAAPGCSCSRRYKGNSANAGNNS